MIVKQAFVQEDPASFTQQRFPFLFDPDAQAFLSSHFKGKDFPHGFVEQPGIPFDLAAVDLDGKLAEQLIEVEFDHVLFHLSDFPAELQDAISPI